MTNRPSVRRRLAAAVLGVERPGRGTAGVVARRELPFGRRVLAAVLGVRVSGDSGQGAASASVQGAGAGVRPESAPPSPPAPPPRLRVAPAYSASQPAGVQGSPPGEEPPETPWTPPRSGPRSPYRTGSVPQHLLSEDRRDFEQILDDALRSAPHRPELAAVGQRFNSEQLRTMALNAIGFITAAAAAEYEDYVRVREEARRPVPSAFGRPAEADGVSESAGAGAIAAVLAPVLAGTSAAVFLFVGYALKLLDSASGVARTMLTTGWVFGAVTAAAILVAAVGLLVTALRNGSSSAPGASGEPGGRVAMARDAWREALLERGILPFLRDALSEPGTPAAPHPTPTTGRSTPRVGYSRPGFSSPEGGSTPGTRPGFSSPDYTSPDFGGPEHQPE